MKSKAMPKKNMLDSNYESLNLLNILKQILNEGKYEIFFLFLFFLPLLLKIGFALIVGGGIFIPNIVINTQVGLFFEVLYYIGLFTLIAFLIRKHKVEIGRIQNAFLTLITIFLIIPNLVFSYGFDYIDTGCAGDKLFRSSFTEFGYYTKTNIYDQENILINRKIAQYGGGTDLKIEVSKNFNDIEEIKNLIICYERKDSIYSYFLKTSKNTDEIFVKSTSF